MAEDKDYAARDHAEGEAAVFKALADPTRRHILEQLRGGELAAGDISSRFPISGPSVSRHLAVLKAAGLISERRDANRILYSSVPEKVGALLGAFLSAVGADQVRGARSGNKKAKATEKQAAKRKHKP
jgi:DNA-binding transcriptional ArsR family regulator